MTQITRISTSAFVTIFVLIVGTYIPSQSVGTAISQEPSQSKGLLDQVKKLTDQMDVAEKKIATLELGMSFVRPRISPIGSIIPFAANDKPNTEIFLACDGSMKSRKAYPKLAKLLGNSWGKSTDDEFRLPDLRGLFLRGVDDKSGRDQEAEKRVALRDGGATKDNVGSFQADAIQEHQHMAWTGGNRGGTEGQLVRDGQTMSPTKGNVRGVNLDTARVSEETRPKNVAVRYLIRAK